MLRLSTTHGDYAVKELRNTWGEPRWLDWLEEGWRLETACVAAGVPRPEPRAGPTAAASAWVSARGAAPTCRCACTGGSTATTVPREPVDVALADWVGGTLADGARGSR